MIHNEEELDKLTGTILRKTGIDEPSLHFTESVMRSVVDLESRATERTTSHYFWWLLLIPALVAGGWYLSVSPGFMNPVLEFSKSAVSGISTVFSLVMDFINLLLSISVSPIELIGSAAVLSLLVLDSIFSGRRQQV